MSKIINVIPQDDFTLWIEFEHGHKILFNMQKLIKTIPYFSLKDLKHFKEVRFEEKTIFWEQVGNKNTSIFPARLTLDNILFTLRDDI